MKIALILLLTGAGLLAGYNGDTYLALAAIGALLLWAGYEIYTVLRNRHAPRDRP
jgi:hypothetical protein